MAGGSVSVSQPQSPLDLFGQAGPGQSSGSVSEVFDQLLRPDELSGMRTGGPSHEFLVDSLVVMPGKRFDTGTFFCFAVWQQRH